MYVYIASSTRDLKLHLGKMVAIFLNTDCFSALCGLTVVGIFLLVCCMYSMQFSALKRLGVAGPKPTLLFGNAKEYCTLGPLKFMQQLINQYGNVCGYYYGAKPILVIADSELIDQVLCKDFTSFSEREHVVDYLKKKAAKCRGLLQAKGEAWERARRIIHPSLKSTGTLLPIVKTKCEAISKVLAQYAKSGEAVDLYRIYGQFTMETILAVVFNHQVGILHGEEDQFTRLSQCVLREGQAAAYFGGGDFSVPVLLSNFPFLECFVRMHYSSSEAGKSSKLLANSITELINGRRANAPQPLCKHQDVLQTMIDGKDQQQLSMDEIVAHSKNLLLAGFESTANLLSYTSYLLALNPDKQERLHEAIVSYFEQNPSADPSAAADNIPYLLWVIQESLRLYPPIHVLHRHCVQDTQIGSLKIPKGLTVRIPIHFIHHSTKFWEEPERFNPERFQQKARKHAFLPFGAGKRQCMGKMLAETTAKLFFVHILREYKLVKDPKTEVPLKTQCGITVSPTNGIYLRIEKRL